LIGDESRIEGTVGVQPDYLLPSHTYAGAEVVPGQQDAAIGLEADPVETKVVQYNVEARVWGTIRIQPFYAEEIPRQDAAIWKHDRSHPAIQPAKLGYPRRVERAVWMQPRKARRDPTDSGEIS
jgi:hypothetical protein